MISAKQVLAGISVPALLLMSSLTVGCTAAVPTGPSDEEIINTVNNKGKALMIENNTWHVDASSSEYSLSFDGGYDSAAQVMYMDFAKMSFKTKDAAVESQMGVATTLMRSFGRFYIRSTESATTQYIEQNGKIYNAASLGVGSVAEEIDFTSLLKEDLTKDNAVISNGAYDGTECFTVTMPIQLDRTEYNSVYYVAKDALELKACTIEKVEGKQPPENAKNTSAQASQSFDKIEITFAWGADGCGHPKEDFDSAEQFNPTLLINAIDELMATQPIQNKTILGS